MKKRALEVPQWLLKGAVYQVNLRTFSDEGTIKSLIKELPFIAGLGFKIIYLCPVFEEDESNDMDNWSYRQKESGTNNPKNPYRIKDYFKIDSEYGSMEDLEELVKVSHSLELKVIFDLVYAHIAPGASIIKKHPEFAEQDENGRFICTEWHFPKLDFNCQGLREYLWSNMVYYISVLDVDGFRCDVGDMPPNDFWTEGRKRITAIKPDVALINEGTEYFRMVNSFHSSYTFNWHEVIKDVLDKKATVKDLRKRDESYTEIIPYGAYLLRDMDNHDTVTDWDGRIESVFGHDCMELIQVMNYIIRGIPMVYAGNELADMSYLSMFSNRFYRGKYQVTDRSKKHTDESVRRQDVFKALNRIKNGNEVIINGFTKWLDNDANEYIVSFMREYNEKRVVFIGNLSTNEVTCKIDSVNTIPSEILIKGKDGFSFEDGNLTLPPFGFVSFEEKMK